MTALYCNILYFKPFSHVYSLPDNLCFFFLSFFPSNFIFLIPFSISNFLSSNFVWTIRWFEIKFWYFYLLMYPWYVCLFLYMRLPKMHLDSTKDDIVIIIIITISLLSIFNIFIAISPCDSNPCTNGGTCEATANEGFVCLCLPQFTGETCANSKWI